MEACSCATGRRARPRIARCERVCGSSRPSSGPRRCGARVGARRRCTSCSSVSGCRVGQLERDWRLADLEPFDATRAVEMRRQASPPARRGSRAKLMRLEEYAEQWFDDLRRRRRDAGRVSQADVQHVRRATGRTTSRRRSGRCRWPRSTPRRSAATSTPSSAAQPCEGCPRRRPASAARAPGGSRRRWRRSSVNSTLTPLSAMLTDAVDDGLHHGEPGAAAAAWPAPRQPPRRRCSPTRRRTAPKFLEPDEALALLEASRRPSTATMVLAALTTGARRGELLALRWEWIDFAKRRVSIGGQLQGRRARAAASTTPSARSRSTAASPQALGPRRQAEGFVFLAPDGGPWPNQGPGARVPARRVRGRGAAPSPGACGTCCGTRTRACSPPAGSAATSSRS